MAYKTIASFVALFLEIVFLLPLMVDDGSDEATPEQMQLRAQQLSQEMAQLLQELNKGSREQTTQEQSHTDWGALLFAVLRHWQIWLGAAVLVTLVWLCWWLRQRSRDKMSSISETEEEGLEEEEGWEEEESEDEGPDDERDLDRIFARRIQWPMKKLACRSQVVEEAVQNLLNVFQRILSESSLPVPLLQSPIGVGCAFEGWSPLEEAEAVYSLLVPLKPPDGHAFHLELGTTGDMPAKDSRIRVDLQCTCTREQLVENTLCFLHHAKSKLQRSQGPSLLGTFCTDSYLDVHKTALWFQKSVRSAWVALPWSRRYKMEVLPSRRSCKLQLTNASGRTFFVEILFRVQQGRSDIFLSSEATEAFSIPSTTWSESYAVAEAKFFRHIARQVPRGSWHHKCLHVCTRVLLGTALSPYNFKTVVMHLLTTTPLSGWCRGLFLPRLEDILRYVGTCLEEKRLNHFFFGNDNMPGVINLPPAFRSAQPHNLFQHLLTDPDAHAQALREFHNVQDRLLSLLFYSHEGRPSCAKRACLQRSQLMPESHLVEEGRRGQKSGCREERENPVPQPSAKSSSVLLSTVSSAQQPVTTTAATKVTTSALFFLVPAVARTAFCLGPPVLAGSSVWAGTKPEAALMLPPCVRWGPRGESPHPPCSPGSWSHRTEHTGHAEDTARLTVGSAAVPFLHTESTL
ncbi:inositol 1,4,5-trisphosphate receptor-interacting protein-like 1 [Leptosomus discolor]